MIDWKYCHKSTGKRTLYGRNFMFTQICCDKITGVTCECFIKLYK